ncbi:hypothetical protein BCR43DRAFT_291345 [Syncephalastrum racemosum]|uniref:Uncharacterized protein n=1 Tax=Syncephalastrum racemosum TaxID=13706 RepID=A0A1X2HDK8_SYNRA|nr:hypothetical protein BCR43DRAFT_291345 [Syncephalastrum racemosum]
MKFTLHNLLSLTLVLVCALGVFAAPLQDLSVTSVDLAEQAANAQGDEHLYVTVSRTDDLVDDDGSLLAERVMTVQVTFDVVDTQLHCNGVPVEIGVSNIQVQAQIASNPEKLTVASEEEAALLEDSFDIGLATVEVTAAILDELKTDDGLTVLRLSVQEKIVEINGEQVVQTEAGQQIIDIFEDGKVQKWAVDPSHQRRFAFCARPDCPHGLRRSPRRVVEGPVAAHPRHDHRWFLRYLVRHCLGYPPVDRLCLGSDGVPGCSCR